MTCGLSGYWGTDVEAGDRRDDGSCGYEEDESGQYEREEIRREAESHVVKL